MSEQRGPSGSPATVQRGLLFTSSGAVVNIAFLLAEAMIAARLVSPDGFGIYTLLVALANFLVVAIDLGGKTAVTQMLASSSGARQSAIASNALALRLLACAAVSGVVWLAQGPLTALDSTPGLVRYLGYLPPMLVAMSLDELFSGMLQGFQSYRHIAAALVLRSVLRLGLTATLLIVFDLGPLALIYSWIISFTASSLYQYLALPRGRGLALHRPLLGELLRFGAPLQITRLLWFAFRRIDVLILGSIAGPAGAAFYAVASRIPDALQRMSESYTTVFFPTMSSLLNAGEREEATRMLNRSVRLISFLAGLAALGGVVYSRPITLLLFSERYLASAPVLAVLMLGFHMTLVVSLLGYTLTAAGYPGRSLGENLTRTAVNVGGDLLLIPIYGFLGPAFAALIAAYVGQPIVVWLLKRSGGSVEVRPYAIQTLALLLCTGLFWLVQGGLIFGTTIMVIFITVNILFSTISWDDLSLILPRRAAGQAGVAQESLSNGN